MAGRRASESEASLARKGRTAGLVIAVTVTIWVLAQWVGPELGLPIRWAFLVDFAALAALFWALVVTYQIWRARQDGKG
jgi:Family of unknown function (DUF5337)